MTIRCIESWKTYLNASPQVINGALVSGDVNGDINRRFTYISGNFTNMHLANLSTIMVGFWITVRSRPPSVTNSSLLHMMADGELNTSNQIGFGGNPDGTLSVFQGDNFSGLGGTTVGNGTTVLAIGVPYWIELECVVASGTGGSVTLKINGATEIALTGINTDPRSTGYINKLSFIANAYRDFGPLYVGDGADGFLGPCDVVRLYPRSFAGETYPNYSLSAGKFDSTIVTDRSQTPAPLNNPPYIPTTIHHIQAIRWVTAGTPPTAYVAMYPIGTSLTSAGLFAPDDSLYVEALVSFSRVAPSTPHHHHHAALPG